MNSTAKDLIRQRFLAPTALPRTNYIGIEIEMPVATADGSSPAL